MVTVLLAIRRPAGRGSLVKILTDTVRWGAATRCRIDTPMQDVSSMNGPSSRTLYAQCPTAGPSRVIFVLGASSSSGSSVVASRLAASSPAPVVTVFRFCRSRTATFGNRQPKEQPSAPSPPAGVVGEERSAE
jgi:hypothetical protein